MNINDSVVHHVISVDHLEEVFAMPLTPLPQRAAQYQTTKGTQGNRNYRQQYHFLDSRSVYTDLNLLVAFTVTPTTTTAEATKKDFPA